MITGIAQVVFLKNFISFGKCQRSWLFLPITLFLEAATRREMIICPFSRKVAKKNFGAKKLFLFRGLKPNQREHYTPP
jgi:hypothetical protein